MIQRESFAGLLDSLSSIRALVRGAAARARLDAARSYRLVLAVDEIATNIVVHGYEEANRAGEIGVSVAMNDEGIDVTLDDDAAPYDPTRQGLPSPEDLASLPADRQAGGLGVFLARTVDVFRYERVDGKNRTTLGMRR
jgi:anti-sigma regulatory factor (Ser/Thr protein kinase)